MDVPNCGSGLSKTFLIKFLYLADCLYAEENGGETFAQAEWEFLHFGPYSASLVGEVQALVNANFVSGFL